MLRKSLKGVACITAGSVAYLHAEGMMLANGSYSPDAKLPPRAAITMPLATATGTISTVEWRGVDHMLGLDRKGPPRTEPLKGDRQTEPSQT